MSAWISVKAALPEDGTLCVVYAETADPGDPFVAVSRFHRDRGGWYAIPWCFCERVSRWFEVPKLEA